MAATRPTPECPAIERGNIVVVRLQQAEGHRAAKIEAALAQERKATAATGSLAGSVGSGGDHSPTLRSQIVTRLLAFGL